MCTSGKVIVLVGVSIPLFSTNNSYAIIQPMNTSKNKAFTIIELLIVIVIIGVLVAITAVSYNGITKSAKESALKSELKQANTELEVAKAKTGTTPTNTDSFTPTKSGTLSISTNPEQNSWCLSITPNTNNQSLPSFNITSDSGTIQEGGCPTPFTNGSHIQTATRATCPTTRAMAVDARDKHTYWIQKLADGNCWMLTNLAYAGGTSNGGTNTYRDVINQGTGAPGTNSINGPDNAGSTTLDLAKYYISPSANPTIDPTPPSTDTTGGGSGAGRQYGYYYNYCAAMGGQNTAACANAETPAPDPSTNICPAGWRLPTGGEFTALNTAINGGLTNTDAGLLANGLFQRSGYWGSGFGYQGSGGYYWSSSQNSSAYARNLYFGSTSVNPANNLSKVYGFTVRCIAL